MNEITETITNSYGNSVIKSLKGAIVGVILFIISFVILWSNEKDYVKNNLLLNELIENSISINSNSVDISNENKIIHITGKAITNDNLGDELITINNTIILDRIVEMYQWKENKTTETKNNLGGSTTKTIKYNYEKQWENKIINSDNFHYKENHKNPNTFPINSETFTSKNVKLGNFNIQWYNLLQLKRLNYSNIKENDKYKIYNNEYYSGDPLNPVIGDIKIKYKYLPSQSDISIIGVQYQNTIVPYSSKNGDILLIENGILSTKNMINNSNKKNKEKVWIFRITGCIVMIIGLNLMANPFFYVLKIIPFLFNVVQTVSMLFLTITAIFISTIIISIAWLFYRPIYVCLIIILVSFIYYLYTKKRNNIIKN